MTLIRAPLLIVMALASAPLPARAADAEARRWRAEALEAQIVRDDWGIAHVHGATDADAVFAMTYAQAEDDFNRVETNYINGLGRLAEAEGEAALYQDLRMKLFIDPDDLKARYAKSPVWLRRLMDAWADGLNYYLFIHPQVVPRVIKRFEPWMALSFTEGSIGGDIEKVSLSQLKAFYGDLRQAETRTAEPQSETVKEPSGSNGVAIAPSNTRDHHALLLINPHTSFFFRSELQVTSGEGLNAYGAATWGQFFIYQGFNDRVGWMHTSTGADAVDEYLETIVNKDGRLYARHGGQLFPVQSKEITVPYRQGDGSLKTRRFTVYSTAHGPIIRAQNGKWVSIALMQKPVEALMQGFLRTKARSYADYMKVMKLKANSSNNTIYADADGHIAYLHPQFIPVRDDRFDFTLPVDGEDPAADWKSLTPLEALPRLLDPPVGWIMNTNDWPYSAAGPDSPDRSKFPRYMDQAGENPRGLHATLLLSGKKDFTLESLNAAAFDSYLPAFHLLIPRLVEDFDALKADSDQRAALAGPVALLRGWDDRWAANSTATSLAVFWGRALEEACAAEAKQNKLPLWRFMAERSTPSERLNALGRAVARLQADFGGWSVAWGEINRFQRLTDDIVPTFTDAGASVAVPFTSSDWGSLASFGARPYPGTRRWYGTSGNSFVAVVEFGPKVRAVAVTAGGESGHPQSPHFDDEADRYRSGNLRSVYFYPEDLQGHVERRYHPGE